VAKISCGAGRLQLLRPSDQLIDKHCLYSYRRDGRDEDHTTTILSTSGEAIQPPLSIRMVVERMPKAATASYNCIPSAERLAIIVLAIARALALTQVTAVARPRLYRQSRSNHTNIIV
jgi:hypothetical protein